MVRGIELVALWLLVFVVAAAESAVRYASRARLEDIIEDRRRSRRYLEYMQRGRLIDVLCVLARVAAGVTFVMLIFDEIGDRYGPAGAGLISAAVLAVGAELPGRLLGRRFSAGVLFVLLPPLWWASLVLEPFRLFRRRVLGPQDEQPPPDVVEAAKEEIRVAIEDGTAEGALGAAEKEMIEGILEFRDVEVDEVMTPRTEMECLELETPLTQAVGIIQEFRHSRIPVFQETRDKVVGMIYVKDLLPHLGSEQGLSTSLADLMREPYFIPETKRVGQLLREFQRQHVQIAMIVDEYGGVSGLVTVEDIMEEIVGEIEDEYDEENHEQWISRRSPTTLEVDARVHIDEINRMLDVNLPEDEDYDTMGGLVMARFARVPAVGEETHCGPLRLHILQADHRRIKRILLELLEEQQTGQET